MAKKTRKTKDFIFTFRHPLVHCTLDKFTYGEKDVQRVQQDLAALQQEVCIDRSYVNYAGTKYKKTFIDEDAWNRLCDAVRLIGKKPVSGKIREELYSAYRKLIELYFMHALADAGYDTTALTIEVLNQTAFNVEVQPDNMREWEKYPGDWREWL